MFVMPVLIFAIFYFLLFLPMQRQKKQTMQKNLTVKTIAIVITLLVCVFGIIGFPKSKAELMANLQKNIRLGLDLRGGSHLILQVQVQDALKSEADNVIEQLKGEMNKTAI